MKVRFKLGTVALVPWSILSLTLPSQPLPNSRRLKKKKKEEWEEGVIIIVIIIVVV